MSVFVSVCMRAYVYACVSVCRGVRSPGLGFVSFCLVGISAAWYLAPHSRIHSPSPLQCRVPAIYSYFVSSFIKDVGANVVAEIASYDGTQV